MTSLHVFSILDRFQKALKVQRCRFYTKHGFSNFANWQILRR